MLESDKTEYPKELENLEISLLLEAIYQYYGYDFRNYSYSSIKRRIKRRLYLDQLNTVTALQENVLHDPSTIEKLLEDFSIKVTEMFRDPSFFLLLREQVLPRLASLPKIKIWHAGCATGEEVYSMSILLHEAGLAHKTQIYATDFNEKAIEQAKQHAFVLDKMRLYTSNYQKSGGTKAFSEYYTATSKHARFHDFLNSNITFLQHNLVTDGSINEFNIIICRNVLIYFDKALQSQVNNLFYDSLIEGGFLCLGPKENLPSNMKNHYRKVNEQENIFIKHG